MPTKWDRIDDATILAYLDQAPSIFESLAAEHPFAIGGYVDSLYEHVKAKHRKMWDQALKTYNLAPDPTTARGIAAWLVRFCGRNSSRLAVIIDLIVNGDLDNFMMQFDSTIPKLNQEQWDRIAPLFTDFENKRIVIMLLISIKTNSKPMVSRLGTHRPAIHNMKIGQQKSLRR